MNKLNKEQVEEAVKSLTLATPPVEGKEWFSEGKGTLSLITVTLPPSMADSLMKADRGLAEKCGECQERNICDEDRLYQPGDLIRELMTKCIQEGFRVILQSVITKELKGVIKSGQINEGELGNS